MAARARRHRLSEAQTDSDRKVRALAKASASCRECMWILSATRLCCHMEQLLIAERRIGVVRLCNAGPWQHLPSAILLLGCLCSDVCCPDARTTARLWCRLATKETETHTPFGGGFANASPYRPVGHGHKRAAGRGKGACRVRKIQCMGFGPVNEFAGRAWPCGHGEDDCSFGCGGEGEPKELAVTSL